MIGWCRIDDRRKSRKRILQAEIDVPSMLSSVSKRHQEDQSGEEATEDLKAVRGERVLTSEVR